VDIIGNAGDVRVLNPNGAANVDGFTAIDNLGEKTDLQKAAFRTTVRTADTGKVIPAGATGDFIIDSYFGQNLDAADVIAAYTQG